MFSSAFMRPKPLGLTREFTTSAAAGSWALLHPGQYAVTASGAGGGGGGGDPFYTSLEGEAGAIGSAGYGTLTICTNVAITVGAGGAGGVLASNTTANGSAGSSSGVTSYSTAVMGIGGAGGRGAYQSYHATAFNRTPIGNGGWGAAGGGTGYNGGPGSVKLRLIG
ncbi:hypothetical protein [Pseudomonas sp. RIT-PI-AD]|uniref:glycine-rich domain-containing protein n=1 Tax=Pseudomonas sp. RIT-PI-AD TaxID=3035294 RepID=UPI0021D9CFC7|nr:hypothetical protein [Pseudomonas sp. RIT-PI-AD]